MPTRHQQVERILSEPSLFAPFDSPLMIAHNMADYTRHQKKIIERYYDQLDEIMLNKLGELVTDLMLADTPTKADRLWKRVEQAMTNLKVPAAVAQHILAQRDVQVLAKNLKSWLTEAKKK